MAIMLNSRSNVYENIFSSASQPPDSSAISQLAGIAGGAALDDADLDRLPAIIARPHAVLHDTERPGELLYVFEPAIEDGRKGKVIVRVNFTDRLKLDGADRASVTTNSVRSAGYVQARDLPESRYRPVQGAVE